jgi:two-component system phosphate regulon sensor histidine kinase PhoR
MSTTSVQAPYADAAHPPHRPVPWWGWLLATALLFAAGVSGAAFAPPGSGLAVWWPAAGIALAFALLQPVRRIPLAVGLVLVVITAANAAAGRPLPLAAALGVANTVEVLIALGVLQAWRRTFRLSSLRAALRFAGAAAIAAIAVGVLAGLALSILGDGELWPTVPFVAASHAAALLTIAPFAVLPPRIPVPSTRSWRGRRSGSPSGSCCSRP